MLPLVERRGRLGHVAVIAVALGIALIGCADRLDSVADEDEALSDQARAANEALSRAELAMEAAGVTMDFGDIENLDRLAENLPNPEDLGTPQVQAHLETAIGSFYEVLDTVDGSVLEAPGQVDDIEDVLVLSESDRALVNLQLAYLYVLDAVSRLEQAGRDLYAVEWPRDLTSGEVYRFRLNIETAGLTPDEVLAQFDGDQRQAVLDAVRILEAVEASAGGRRASVDETLFRESALHHVTEGAAAIKEVAPELAEALDDFDATIDDLFAAGIVDELENWGFEVEDLGL